MDNALTTLAVVGIPRFCHDTELLDSRCNLSSSFIPSSFVPNVYSSSRPLLSASSALLPFFDHLIVPSPWRPWSSDSLHPLSAPCLFAPFQSTLLPFSSFCCTGLTSSVPLPRAFRNAGSCALLLALPLPFIFHEPDVLSVLGHSGIP